MTLYRVLDNVFCVSYVGGLALLVSSTHPWVSIGVWVVGLLVWIAAAERLRIACPQPSGSSLFPLLPTIIFVQYGLDRWMQHLGSALILFGHVAAIAAILRSSTFPTARVRR